MNDNTDTFQYGALYIRVSTDKQEELSPDAQKRLLLDYAKAHDILILPEHIYIENGISGRKAAKRPEFQRMIGMAKSKEAPFSVILVWKFSRFARNQEESIVYKSMLKKQCNIDVISITEPLIDGPFGTLIERIIEWMDEYYSINLSNEVLRGMTEKAMRGGYQTTPPYGYASSGHGKPFAVVPAEAEIVKYIFEEYAYAHKDPTAIARALNERKILTKRKGLFERRNITYILKNQFYIGKLIWNGIERDGIHETFISKELFEEANERLNATFTPKRRRNISTCSHWLSGLVKCSHCGASLAYNYSKDPFFNCWKYAKGMHQGSSWITEKMLVRSVLGYFEDLISGQDFSFSYHSPAASSSLDDTALYQSQLSKLSIRLNRIQEAYEFGIDTLEEYKEKKQQLIKEKERLLLLLEQLNTAQEDPEADRKLMMERIKNVYDVLRDDSVDYETKGNFIRSVVEEIIWNRQQNTLEFHLYMAKNA